jgi:hypothetical protein
VAIAFAIYLFFFYVADGTPFIRGADPEWARYGLYGILAASIPSLWYLRRFKRTLNADVAVTREHKGVPDPRLRAELLRRMSLGGALSELPLALGTVYLLSGGEKRWFVAAACVTVALRLSYRPFKVDR